MSTTLSMTNSQPRLTVNRDLLLPYFAPYASYVIIATFAEDLNRELDYALRIVVMGGLLWFFRKQYKSVIGPKSPIGSILFGAAAGVVAAFVWAGLVLPFHDAATGDAYGARAFALRLAAATLIVPFAEELLCRGYILGLFTQWQQEKRSGKASFGDVIDSRSIHELPPGAWSLLGVIVSVVAFAVGHAPAQWLAALAYGLIMAGLWIVRRDLLTPIVAHAVTNLALYIYVFKTQSWGLW